MKKSVHICPTQSEEMSKHYSIIAQGSVAQIRLTGNITWWKNTGDEFMALIDAMLEAGMKDVNCYMNCGGGNTIEANEICNQIKRFPGSRSLQIGAICASAGTIVAMAFDKDKVTMAKNGMFMIHNMVGCVEGGEKDIEAYLNLMKTMTANYIQMYVSWTGLPEEKIKAMLDATTWMNVETAKGYGFIAGSTEEVEADPEMIAEITAMYKNIPQAVFNQIQNITPTKKDDMKKVISALNMLGYSIATDASEEAVAMMVDKLAKDKNAAEVKLAEVTASAAQANATMIIDAAIEAKKIGEGEKEAWMKDAIANPEMAKRALSKIPGVAPVSKNLGTDESKTSEDRSKWTLRDWMDKDAKGTIEMRDKKPEAYKALYKAQYGKECEL
jgi:ATP-dependent Clp protease protease subunit